MAGAGFLGPEPRLAGTAEGKARALAIYKKASPSYHPITRTAIEEILGRANVESLPKAAS